MRIGIKHKTRTKANRSTTAKTREEEKRGEEKRVIVRKDDEKMTQIDVFFFRHKKVDHQNPKKFFYDHSLINFL